MLHYEGAILILIPHLAFIALCLCCRVRHQDAGQEDLADSLHSQVHSAQAHQGSLHSLQWRLSQPQIVRDYKDQLQGLHEAQSPDICSEYNTRAEMWGHCWDAGQTIQGRQSETDALIIGHMSVEHIYSFKDCSSKMFQ